MLKIKPRKFLDNFIWVVYIFYLFTILAFGERAEYNKYSNITFVVMCALMIFSIIIRRRKLIAHKIDFALVPFGIFAIISILWSYCPDVTTTRAVTVARLLIMGIILAMYICDVNAVRKYLYGIVIAGFLFIGYLVSFYGLSQIKTLVESSKRIGGAILNENSLGMFMAISAIIMLFLFMQNKNLIWAIGVALLVVFAVITGSRKAILDIAVGFILTIVMSIFDENKKNNTRWIRVILGLLVFVCAAYILWQLPVFDTMRERVEGMFTVLSTGSSKAEYSAYSRSQMILYGLRQFCKTPILGIGIGASGYITKLFDGTDTYLHCNYAELLATGGLIGTLLYYIPFLTLIRSCWKSRKYSFESRILIVLLIIAFVNDIAAVQYFSKLTYVLFGICASNYSIQKDVELRKAKSSINKREIFLKYETVR